MQPECAAAAYLSARRKAAVSQADAWWLSARCVAKQAEVNALFPVVEQTHAVGARNRVKALLCDLDALVADYKAAAETHEAAVRRFAAANDALDAHGPVGQEALTAYRDALNRIRAQEDQAEALAADAERDPIGLVKRGVRRVGAL
jgi:hypothetical protein